MRTAGPAEPFGSHGRGRIRQIGAKDVDALAAGAQLLSGGGDGGDGAAEAVGLMLRKALTDSGPVPLVTPSELASTSRAAVVSCIGTPTALDQRPLVVSELVRAIRRVELRSGPGVDAVMPWQCGGLPALFAVLAASRLGLPLIDADTVGRGYRTLTRSMVTVIGADASPVALADGRGATIVINGMDTRDLDLLLGNVLPKLGGWAVMAARPLVVGDTARALLTGSLSRTYELGELLRAGDRAEMAKRHGVRTLFHGRVAEVQRRMFRNRPAGTVVIEHAELPDRVMRVEMQSEFLAVLEDGWPLACTPDLICLLEHGTAACLTPDQLRCGLQVDVLGLPCHPQWRSERGLALSGPRSFGYDFEYTEMDGKRW